MALDLERATLRECEEVIQHSLDAFVEAGRALLRIRDGRLYSARFPNFEAYCQARWGFSRTRSTQLIAAAEVTAVVVANGQPPPTNERVARPLAALREDPEKLTAAWHEASNRAAQYDRAPTSNDVQAAVNGKVMGPVARVPTQPAPGSDAKVDAIVEAWATLANASKQIITMERDLMLEADLTDNQRWRIAEAHKHAVMAVER